MRPIITIIETDLGDVPMVVLNYHDSNGQPADHIVKPITDVLTLIDTVLNVMSVHNVQTVDMLTDSEEIFSEFIAIPGVNVSLVSSAEVAPLYRVLSPDSNEFPALWERYLTARDVPSVKATLWDRFIRFITNLRRG